MTHNNEKISVIPSENGYIEGSSVCVGLVKSHAKVAFAT